MGFDRELYKAVQESIRTAVHCKTSRAIIEPSDSLLESIIER